MLDWPGCMDESGFRVEGKKLGRGLDYSDPSGVPRTLAHQVEKVRKKRQRLHGVRHLVS